MGNFLAEQLFAFMVFAVVSSVTPGPNNIMMMSSGLNYGFIRSVPHLLGISLGFGFMVFATGIGLYSVFQQFTWIQDVLKYIGAIYLFWLALRIGLSSSQPLNVKHQAAPLTFFEAAVFQWVNPKAWVMAVAAVTVFLPTPSIIIDIGVLAGVYALVSVPCVAIWAGFGLILRTFMDSPQRRKIFNWFTAILLMISIYPIIA